MFGLNGFNIPTLGGASGSAKKPFLKTLTVADLWTSSQTTASGKFVKLGSYTVPAQQEISWGWGSPLTPDNQGYVYVLLKNVSNATVQGVIRLAVSNAPETAIDIIFDERTDILAGSTTDRKLQK